MAKKLKKVAIDGPSPDLYKKLHGAVRKVWSWSTARRITAKRCLDEEGYPVCEKCSKKVPKIQIDHIVPCGPLDSPGFFDRLLVPSSGLMALCSQCHREKTKEDLRKMRDK